MDLVGAQNGGRRMEARRFSGSAICRSRPAVLTGFKGVEMNASIHPRPPHSLGHAGAAPGARAVHADLASCVRHQIYPAVTGERAAVIRTGWLRLAGLRISFRASTQNRLVGGRQASPLPGLATIPTQDPHEIQDTARIAVRAMSAHQTRVGRSIAADPSVRLFEQDIVGWDWLCPAAARLMKPVPKLEHLQAVETVLLRSYYRYQIGNSDFS